MELNFNLGQGRVTISEENMRELYLDSLMRPKAPPPHLTGIRFVPNLGQLWEEEGGWYVGLCRGENGDSDYRLVLPRGENGKPIFLEDQEWGERGVENTLARSPRNGIANTRALIEAGNALAKKLATVKVPGAPDGQLFTDCYWPALCEVNQVYANGAGLLPDHVFWSSTEDDASDAFYQGFVSGLACWCRKDLTWSAFPVRRVYL